MILRVRKGIPSLRKRWFDGWKGGAPPPGAAREPPEDPEVAPARFWLLRQGWRRHGLVALSEVPGTARR